MAKFEEAVGRVAEALKQLEAARDGLGKAQAVLADAETELAEARTVLMKDYPDLLGPAPASPSTQYDQVEVDDPDGAPPDLGAGPMEFRERT